MAAAADLAAAQRCNEAMAARGGEGGDEGGERRSEAATTETATAATGDDCCAKGTEDGVGGSGSSVGVGLAPAWSASMPAPVGRGREWRARRA